MKKLKVISFNKHADQDNCGLRSLNTRLVYFIGDSGSISRLGKFLLKCAVQMKQVSSFHRHFRDSVRSWSQDIVDVVVESSKSPEGLKKRSNHSLRLTALQRRARGK